MARQVITNGESGLITRNKLNDNFVELYTGKDSVTVNTYADLPAPATVSGQKYWVLTSTGVWLVNRRQAGSYYSDGIVWSWLGDNPTTADQVGNVPAGTVVATNVQAAINELDSDKADGARQINTTAPLTGGGNLFSDRTLGIDPATTGAAGSMSAADKTKLDGIATGATVYTDENARDAIGAALIAGSNITITVNDPSDTITIAASGSGGSPLTVWDSWIEQFFGNTSASNYFWSSSAIGSGTNNSTPPTASQLGYNRYGLFLRSSATANSGFAYNNRSTGTYFGVVSHKFRGAFLWRTDFTDRTVRVGFLDTATVTDAVDGAYFEIVGSTCSAKTASNSSRTTNGTTATLALDTPYVFDVEVNAAGTSVRFRIYEGTNPTPILDVTNTTDIPTTSARLFGSGLVATCNKGVTSDIGILYFLAEGTIEGFTRARG